MPGVTRDLSARLRCGVVRVPRDRAQPDGAMYALAVVVIAPDQPATHADPVVHISGGPGSPLTKYAAYQAAHPYAPGRDTILVDQRGMGASEPRLCPDHEAALLPSVVHAIAQDRPDADAVHRAAYAACRDEALRLGHDLRNFGTLVTAEDLNDVRLALGVAQWNIDGVSYGTNVAMTLAALHPGTVRAVVLDSVYAPDPAPRFADNFRDSRTRLFAECERDAKCARAYPDLSRTYDEAMDRLGATPLPLTPAAPGAPDRLTAGLFEEAIALLLYTPPAYPFLPHLVQSVRDGDTGAIEPVVAALYRDREESFSANAAVECRDRAHLHVPSPSRASLGDGLAEICNDWVPVGPPPAIPAGSPVAFLVMAGEYDPVSRPAFTRHLADVIGANARFVEFPRLGHDLRFNSPCAAAMEARFIDHPDQAPDTACAAQRPPIPFTTP